MPRPAAGSLALPSCAFALAAAGALGAQSAGGMLDPGWERGGAAADAEAGRCLVAARDFDGDGRRDLLASALAPGGLTEVSVLSSGDGRVLQRITLPRQYGLLRTEALASLRDVDGDGVPEIAIGEQHYVTGYDYDGLVTLHSGRTGAVLWSVTRPNEGGHLGSWLAAAGDVNQDGFEDLLVHAPTLRALGPPYISGGALLLSGLDGAELRRFAVADLTHQVVGERRVAGAGDVDGDGSPDLLVSGLGNSSGSQLGRVALFSGATGALLREHLATSTYGTFGCSVAFAGDVDRDGVPDYAYSDPYYGLVWLRSGATGQLIHLLQGSSAQEFGAGLEGGRDLDGDAVPDLLVTERESGLLHLMSGATGELALSIGALGASDLPGFGACALDDADRDGCVEFAWAGAHSALPGAASRSGFVRIAEFPPCIEQDRPTISALAGGTVHWALDFPDSEAGQPYLLLASGQGPGSGLFEGILVPLVQDAVFARMLAGAPRAFAQAAGTLDALGRAAPSLALPAGAGLPFLGSTIRFSAVVGPAGARRGASAAASLTVRP